MYIYTQEIKKHLNKHTHTHTPIYIYMHTQIFCPYISMKIHTTGEREMTSGGSKSNEPGTGPTLRIFEALTSPNQRIFCVQKLIVPLY